jgi:hypothetical protein
MKPAVLLLVAQMDRQVWEQLTGAASQCKRSVATYDKGAVF